MKIPVSRTAKIYLSGLLRKNEGPVYLIHFITLRCNAECEHCFVPINTGKQEMTLEEIRRFTRECPPLLYVALTGGEPLLREDYADIVDAYVAGPRPLILHSLTNGAFPEKTEKLAAAVSRRHPNLVFSLGVSLDGLEEEHDRVRKRKGLFSKALDTARRLAQVERLFPNFRTEISFTVTPENQARAPDILSQIRSRAGTNSVYFTVKRETFGPDGSPGISEAHYAKILESARKQPSPEGALAGLTRRVTSARNRLIHRVLKEKRMVTSCLAGQLSGVVWDDGTVYACELIHEPLGSLRKSNYDLRQIWKSAAARQMTRRIKETRCFCTHECFNTVNVAFKPWRMATL